jgi:hypothetical protein
MKKTYIIPSIKEMKSDTEDLMEASGVYSTKGIDYGGIDEDGSREAESRRGRNSWTDEDYDLP